MDRMFGLLNFVKMFQFELPPVQPITISIGVDIKDIPKVSDKDFAITLNAYFIVKWHDSRLIVQVKRNKTQTKKDRRQKLCDKIL